MSISNGPKIKVLHVITSSNPGGAQNHLFLLANDLSRLNYDITVVCGDGGPLIDKLRSIGIKVIPHFTIVREIRPLSDLKAIFWLSKLIMKHKFDIVHSHSSKAGVIGRLAGFIARKPKIVFTAHGFVFSDETMNRRKRNFYTLIERWMGYLSDKIIAVSEYDKRIALKHKVASERKIEVILNGVDLKPFEKVEKCNRTKPLVCVGTVTRLVYEKGISYFIEAASLVLKERRNVRFVIAGDGELRELLEKRVREKGLEKSVQFVGHQEDIAQILSSIDIFVISSIKEGLPLALLEAMASGRAIIATRVGGIPEVLEPDRGILVPSLNEEELAKAIINLIDNVQLRVELARNAREYALQNHSSQAVAEKVNEIYRQLLN